MRKSHAATALAVAAGLALAGCGQSNDDEAGAGPNTEAGSGLPKVELVQVDPALLATQLPDFAAAVINGNYAIDAGLSPSKDSLALESGENNPYANFLVTTSARQSEAAIVKLDELLHTAEVKQFIEDTWTDGSVIAAFTPAAGTPEPLGGEVVKLKVGASPVPHGDILRFVQENLAAAAGLDIEIVEYQDYIQPNTALEAGDLDANYFQHQPYLNAQVAEYGYDFFAFAGIHIEPLAVYSDKLDSLDGVKDGDKIGVSNDPANQARGLRLLEKAGVIKLKDTGDQDPTIADVEG
jgi:ABC-type metal ion transport system substrate-binding protein